MPRAFASVHPKFHTPARGHDHHGKFRRDVRRGVPGRPAGRHFQLRHAVRVPGRGLRRHGASPDRSRSRRARSGRRSSGWSGRWRWPVACCCSSASGSTPSSCSSAAIGMVVYFGYSRKRSHLANGYRRTSRTQAELEGPGGSLATGAARRARTGRARRPSPRTPWVCRRSMCPPCCVLFAEDGADAATRFGDEQGARRRVPGLQADFPEAVETARGHVGQVERRRARRAAHRRPSSSRP